MIRSELYITQDEREVIIFSLVAGPSMLEETYTWMQEGDNKKIINVSVTRAKRELIIVGNRSNIAERGGLLAILNTWVSHLENNFNKD